MKDSPFEPERPLDKRIRMALLLKEPSKPSLWARLRAGLVTFVALLSPGGAVPAAQREKDSAPVPVVQNEFDDDVDLDETYKGEEFYRGLPIFDKKGNRCTLHPGKDYVDSYLQLPSGHILQCWREAGHDPVVIDKARIPAA